MNLNYEGKHGLVTVTCPMPSVEGKSMKAEWVMTSSEAVVAARILLLCAYQARGNVLGESQFRKVEGMVLR